MTSPDDAPPENEDAWVMVTDRGSYISSVSDTSLLQDSEIARAASQQTTYESCSIPCPDKLDTQPAQKQSSQTCSSTQVQQAVPPEPLPSTSEIVVATTTVVEPAQNNESSTTKKSDTDSQ